ncbi:MAG: hypothetical protein JEZ03_11030 [Bacteroidales bacterium]|nr:hypothetical protein [Bacteroidales bacterium]
MSDHPNYTHIFQELIPFHLLLVPKTISLLVLTTIWGKIMKRIRK